MRYKALFLDFYGTLVHEDDAVLPLICEHIRLTARQPCDAREVGRFWWEAYSELIAQCNEGRFEMQRALSIQSLSDTLNHFDCTEHAETLIQAQFTNWMEPQIFEDTIPFLNEMKDTPVYILSNIDTADVMHAIHYHGIQVSGIITSEDVKSYKPRPEMFTAALRQYQLEADEVLHIGDSLLNDVSGAQAAGIAAVWLNRTGKSETADITPDYTCSNLIEVIQYIKRDKTFV